MWSGTAGVTLERGAGCSSRSNSSRRRGGSGSGSGSGSSRRNSLHAGKTGRLNLVGCSLWELAHMRDLYHTLPAPNGARCCD